MGDERSAVGLCAGCRHARRVPTPRMLYWRCALAETDPTYPRYPRLPVLACAGHEPGEPAAPGAAGPADRAPDGEPKR